MGGFAQRRLAWAEALLAHWIRYCPGRIAQAPGFAALVRRHNAELFADRPAASWSISAPPRRAPLLRTFAARALLMHRTDLRPLLGLVAQPVLLVHGERDSLVSRGLQDELKQGLPNAARAEIANCGHYPQLTHPEVFSAVVREFLTPAAECSLHVERALVKVHDLPRLVQGNAVTLVHRERMVGWFHFDQRAQIAGSEMCPRLQRLGADRVIRDARAEPAEERPDVA